MKPAASGGPGRAVQADTVQPAGLLAVLRFCTDEVQGDQVVALGCTLACSQLHSWAQTAEPPAPDKSTRQGAYRACMLPLRHQLLGTPPAAQRAAPARMAAGALHSSRTGLAGPPSSLSSPAEVSPPARDPHPCTNAKVMHLGPSNAVCGHMWASLCQQPLCGAANLGCCRPLDHDLILRLSTQTCRREPLLSPHLAPTRGQEAWLMFA